MPAPASNFGARKISSLITVLTLRELGLPADVARLAEITAAWSEAVGEELARHVHPIRYTGGRLVLRAGSAVWVSKVRHSHDTLSRHLRRQPQFRDLVGLEVRAAPLDRRGRSEAPRARPSLSDKTRRLLRSVADDVADPALRATLARLSRSPGAGRKP
jgi:hypothetical protein